MNICRFPAGALSDLPACLLFLQALCRCLLWYWSAATRPTPVTSRQAYQGGLGLTADEGGKQFELFDERFE